MLGFGEGAYMSVQSAINALPAKLWQHVNALNPPYETIPPVAPFVGNQQGCRHDSADFAYKILPTFRSLEYGTDAGDADTSIQESGQYFVSEIRGIVAA